MSTYIHPNLHATIQFLQSPLTLEEKVGAEIARQLEPVMAFLQEVGDNQSRSDERTERKIGGLLKAVQELVNQVIILQGLIK